MATDKDFIDYVCEQVASAGMVSSKKMFGEYMVYCDGRPVLLVCDNTVFVKQLPEVAECFADAGKSPESGVPYKGAKPHYILDPDDGDFAVTVTRLLAKILPLPKPKKAKK